MLLYLIRHGLPNYATDSLLPDGKLQAEAVGKRMAKAGIDQIYASPRGRAIQTAEPAAKALGLDIKIEPWMDESLAARAFGGVDEEGKPVTWAFWQPNKLIGNNSAYEDRDSFSHSYYRNDKEAKAWAQTLERESDAFLSRLGFVRTKEGNGYLVTEKNSKKIAVFAHQGFGLHWLSHLLKIPYHMFTASFDISHTGVSIIHFDESKQITYPRLLMLSDLSHLYIENLSAKYHGYIEI